MALQPEYPAIRKTQPTVNRVKEIFIMIVPVVLMVTILVINEGGRIEDAKKARVAEMHACSNGEDRTQRVTTATATFTITYQDGKPVGYECDQRPQAEPDSW